MKRQIFLALLQTVICMADAQPTPTVAVPAHSGVQADSAKVLAFKKKLTDGIDMRIGKLEELEECIQAAPDMKAIRACRENQAAEAADSKN